MPGKSKKIKLIFSIYWFLLAYVLAALIWWFIALSRQNHEIISLRLASLSPNDKEYAQKRTEILQGSDRKSLQYIGEGAIFLILIGAGALFVYRAVKKQFALNRQQQHFMIAVTHELKTPIAITKLNLETLRKHKLDDKQQQRLLDNTLQETNRMNALCNNLLLSSQFEAGGYQLTREKIDLIELLQGCVHDFKTRNPHKEINFESAGSTYLILGDHLLLQLAVNNLIDNALKYSPKESPLNIKLESAQNIINIKVIDQGPGIQDADKARVFQKFSRLGNEAKGTGLGLYLTQKIILAHHGHIFVEDEKPHGAIFVIELEPYPI